MTNDQQTGYVIGFKELYEGIQGLDRKLDERIGPLASKVENHETRLGVLESVRGKRWELTLAWITAAIALVAAVLSPIISAALK